MTKTQVIRNEAIPDSRLCPRLPSTAGRVMPANQEVAGLRRRFAPPRNDGFIVSAPYDYFFFIFSPLIALFLGISISFTPLADQKFTINGHSESWASLFSGTFIMAHLVIVFFRSHGNPKIFG